ncbi:hypothetical protein [Luteipulveratus mongoliensis]|uniref:hypothetical protein n=1 Tax=Luteipulveratus mongoliensis TaxID=571913 RepID=UPI0012EE808E|nr:hypothetical protein [Luteipulveratus mongoliensis]
MMQQVDRLEVRWHALPTARGRVEDVWIDQLRRTRKRSGPAGERGAEQFHGVACRRCSSLFIRYPSLEAAETARAEHAATCTTHW